MRQLYTMNMSSLPINEKSYKIIDDFFNNEGIREIHVIFPNKDDGRTVIHKYIEKNFLKEWYMSEEYYNGELDQAVYTRR